ncbi:hypothetical protein BGZ76_007619, partial [Entomortierella beljakovae]
DSWTSLARSQKDEIKSITMGTTRWNSCYEMVKRISKMRTYVNLIVNQISHNPADLPLHISIVKVQDCLLSQKEDDVFRDIINPLENASKFGNEAGASLIPTISTMYTKALNLLPDCSTMTTAIGTAVYEKLDQGINNRWSLTPPQCPAKPDPKQTKDGAYAPLIASQIEKLNKLKGAFDITNQQYLTSCGNVFRSQPYRGQTLGR